MPAVFLLMSGVGLRTKIGQVIDVQLAAVFMV
jgi:hypothetical protein